MTSVRTRHHQAALVVAALLASLSRCSCESVGAPCQSSVDCPATQVCVADQCRLTCNTRDDCTGSEACIDGACLPGDTGSDAALVDAANTDAGSQDLLSVDAARSDRHTADLTITDALSMDVPGADLISADLVGGDRHVADAADPDISIANTPPVIGPQTSTAATYPSSAEQSFPVALDVSVSDAENDTPYSLALTTGDDGCEVSATQLTYTPPPGFSGVATCTVTATDSGVPPATSAPVTFTFEVLAPLVSCYWISVDPGLMSLGVGAADGVYLIDPDGPGGDDPFDAFCDMTTQGGGWTLALRARGQEDVSYDSPFWTDPTQDLSEAPAPTYGPSEKYRPFNTLAFSEVLVGLLEEADAPAPPAIPPFGTLQLEVSGASLLDVFVQDDFVSTPWSARDQDAWLALLPGAPLQDSCSREGLSITHLDHIKVRVGIIGNEQNDCVSPDSFIGVGANNHFGSTTWVGGAEPWSAPELAVEGFAVVYVRDTRILSQTLRDTCMAHLLAGEVTSGLYPVDPDGPGGAEPTVSHCELSSYGGGWTLIGTSDDWGQWDEASALSDSAFGTSSLTEDYKSRAYHGYQLHDLMFRSAAPGEMHALYEGFGEGAHSLGDRLGSVGTIACAQSEPNAFHLSAGDLLSPGMCERTLFLNPADQDGGRLTCASQGERPGVGPTWSVAGNDSCPLDDPQDSTFARSYSVATPWGAHPVQIWGRDVDFGALGSAGSCQAHRDLGREISGFYLVTTPASGDQLVYCHMTGGGEGWLRVADFDAGHDATCPGDWQPRVWPRACWRDSTGVAEDIRSATFSSLGFTYQQVRGHVRALQKGTPNGFDSSLWGGNSLDEVYAEGVSITHGDAGERVHIWTYAVGYDEVTSANSPCPCQGGEPAPGFVGADYHCDTAVHTSNNNMDLWYTDNLLFDDLNASACFLGGDPAWFERALPAATDDDLEVRIMADQDSDNEDVGVVRLELYVR